MRIFIHWYLILVFFFAGLKSPAAQVAPATYSNTGKLNYIRTWYATASEKPPVNLISRPVKDVKQVAKYFDVLGRPLQTVVKNGSLDSTIPL